MSDDIYKAPQADLAPHNKTEKVSLWNPDMAGLWSLIFTPLFGSVIVYLNWKALGEGVRAKNTIPWIILSFIIIAVLVFYDRFLVIYILMWYFLCQRRQTLFIKEHYYGKWERKSWLKPILLAFGGMAAFIVVIIFVTLIGLVVSAN